MKNINQYMRRGVALITVMLIVLTLTIIAVFTLVMTRMETQTSSSFKFNRQSAYAAHAVSNHMGTLLNQDGTAGGMNVEDPEVIFQQLMTNDARVFRTADIKGGTGLSNVANDSALGSAQLKGDLARSVTQLGSLEDLNLVIGDVVGMSEANMYCRYNLVQTAVAITGRAAMAGSDNNVHYFTVASLNSRASARKYELTYYVYEPASCH